MGTPRHMTRRTLVRAVAATAVGAVVATPLAQSVSAQQAGETLTVNSIGLRLRSGPGLNYDVVDVLEMGAEVKIRTAGSTTADGYTWLNVTVVASGRVGWLASEFVDSGTSGGGNNSGGAWSSGVTVWVTAAVLNVRASANGSIIATATSNAKGITTGSSVVVGGFDWVPVRFDSGITGWVAGEYLTTSSQTPTPPAGSGFPAGSTVHVDAALLNLRSGASLSAGVIGLYATGTNAVIQSGPVSADGHAWYYVRVQDGTYGWMAGEGLSAGAGDGGGGGNEPTTDRIRVTDGPVNLRTAPGLSGSVIRALPTGEGGDLWSLDTPSVDGYTWIRIRADSSQDIGWIATDFIKYE